MFKRRDWVHVHGQDGEGSSDDVSSDDSDASGRDSSSAADSDSDTDSGSDAQDDITAEEMDGTSSTKRLQDLSEDDFEEAEEPGVDVEELVQNWLTADEAEALKGPPLRCRWCPGTLLLNASSLKRHVESKRHQKRQRLSEQEPQPICLAEDLQEAESEGETHAERLDRLRQLAAPPQLSNLSASQRRRMIRKLRAEQRKKLPKVRPGKRQRVELKAQLFGSSNNKSAKQNKQQQKSQPAQNSDKMLDKAQKAKQKLKTKEKKRKQRKALRRKA